MKTETRAELSQGSSNYAIYQMVVKSLGQPQNGIIVDLGCGQGNLFKYVKMNAIAILE